MALYLLTYDLRQPGRNYSPLYTQLGSWGAIRLAESVWLLTNAATAVAIRDAMRAYTDQNDAVAVIELKAGSAWATHGVEPAGTRWLQTNIP